MKKIEDYMKFQYRIELLPDRDEGGYVASCPDLPGCITSGETAEETLVNLLDAKKAWLEAAIEDGVSIPEPDSLKDYSGQFKIRMPRSLHRALVQGAKREGISMNQYCIYLLSHGDAAMKN